MDILGLLKSRIISRPKNVTYKRTKVRIYNNHNTVLASGPQIEIETTNRSAIALTTSSFSFANSRSSLQIKQFNYTKLWNVINICFGVCLVYSMETKGSNIVTTFPILISCCKWIDSVSTFKSCKMKVNTKLFNFEQYFHKTLYLNIIRIASRGDIWTSFV